MTKANIHTRQYTERVEHEATGRHPHSGAGFHDRPVFIRGGTPRGLNTMQRDVAHKEGYVLSRQGERNEVIDRNGASRRI